MSASESIPIYNESDHLIGTYRVEYRHPERLAGSGAMSEAVHRAPMPNAEIFLFGAQAEPLGALSIFYDENAPPAHYSGSVIENIQLFTGGTSALRSRKSGRMPAACGLHMDDKLASHLARCFLEHQHEMPVVIYDHVNALLEKMYEAAAEQRPASVQIPLRDREGRSMGHYVFSPLWLERPGDSTPAHLSAALAFSRSVHPNARLHVADAQGQVFATLQLRYRPGVSSDSHWGMPIGQVCVDLTRQDAALPQQGIIRTNNLLLTSDLVGKTARVMLEHQNDPPHTLFRCIKRVLNQRDRPHWIG